MNAIYIIISIFLIVAVIVGVFFIFIKNAQKYYKGQKGQKGRDYYREALIKKEGLGTKLRNVFMGKGLGPEEYLQLEENLVSADLSSSMSASLIEKVRSKNINSIDEVINILKKELSDMVVTTQLELAEKELTILLVLGVNGVGKTTSIAKIAHHHLQAGKKVLLAAGDTFRAAATEQLTRWAKELDIPIVKQGQGADPASVVYDAIDSAKAKGVDLLIIDTAGRLQNKKHLMDELHKIHRIIANKGASNYKNLLVIDSTTGQNGIRQAEAFNELIKVDMIMLTKYDALTKGGIVFTICTKLGIPFAYIGKGEKKQDIELFDKTSFVERVFS